MKAGSVSMSQHTPVEGSTKGAWIFDAGRGLRVASLSWRSLPTTPTRLAAPGAGLAKAAGLLIAEARKAAPAGIAFSWVAAAGAECPNSSRGTCMNAS